MTPRDKRVRDPLRILLLADAASPIVGKWVSHCLNMHYETHIMSLNTDIQNVNGAVIHPLRASKASSAKGDYLRALPRVWREVKMCIRDRPGACHNRGGALTGRPRNNAECPLRPRKAKPVRLITSGYVRPTPDSSTRRST